ncbi:MAG: hypothetical protein Q8M96_09115, partial [Rubrivivax sp.]|nr:hypothetical protein [Rubrivivax sp.]
MSENTPLRRLHLLACTSAALALAALAGCASPTVKQPELQAPPAVLQSSLRYQKQYLLAAGDQVDVVVWR